MTDQMVSPATTDPGAPAAVPPPDGQPPPGLVPPVPDPGVGPLLTPQEAQEVELRDHLGRELAEAAIALTKQAAQVSTGDPGQCKDMAQAALYLTEALVLVAPLESTAAVTGPGGPPGPGGAPVPLPPKHSPPQTSTWMAEQQATGRTA